jgi:hypothetical protein
MGHHISAVVLKGSFDEDQAKAFDLKPIRLNDELMLFPLDARYLDYWAEKLGSCGFVSDCPRLNPNVVHLMVNAIASNPLFAVIETDYFGGTGSQAAAVYQGRVEVMAPESSAITPVSHSIGPINNALRQLGVRAIVGRDEFETVGLYRYRDFYDLFEGYESSSNDELKQNESASTVTGAKIDETSFRRQKAWWRFW